MWRPAVVLACIALPVRVGRADPGVIATNAVVPSAVTPSTVTPSAVTPSAVTPSAVAANTIAPGAVDPNTVATNVAAPGAVDAGALMTDDTWRYRRGSGGFIVDGGLAVGFPAALPTGLAKGVGIGLTMGRTLAWGVRASWLTATESSLPWTVTHSDLKLRATGALQASAERSSTSHGSATRACARASWGASSRPRRSGCCRPPTSTPSSHCTSRGHGC